MVTKRCRVTVWECGDVMYCKYSALTYHHTHCPSEDCNGRTGSHATEYHHWKKARESSILLRNSELVLLMLNMTRIFVNTGEQSICTVQMLNIARIHVMILVSTDGHSDQLLPVEPPLKKKNTVGHFDPTQLFAIL